LRKKACFFQGERLQAFQTGRISDNVFLKYSLFIKLKIV
jgi:hypothetical protein